MIAPETPMQCKAYLGATDAEWLCGTMVACPQDEEEGVEDDGGESEGDEEDEEEGDSNGEEEERQSSEEPASQEEDASASAPGNEESSPPRHGARLETISSTNLLDVDSSTAMGVAKCACLDIR